MMIMITVQNISEQLGTIIRMNTYTFCFDYQKKVYIMILIRSYTYTYCILL